MGLTIIVGTFDELIGGILITAVRLPQARVGLQLLPASPPLLWAGSGATAPPPVFQAEAGAVAAPRWGL